MLVRSTSKTCGVYLTVFFLSCCMAILISATKHIQIRRQEFLFGSPGHVSNSRSLGSRSSDSLRSHLSRFVVDRISYIWRIFDLPVVFCLSHIGGRIPMVIHSGPKEILFVAQGSAWSLEGTLFLRSSILKEIFADWSKIRVLCTESFWYQSARRRCSRKSNIWKEMVPFGLIISLDIIHIDLSATQRSMARIVSLILENRWLMLLLEKLIRINFTLVRRLWSLCLPVGLNVYLIIIFKLSRTFNILSLFFVFLLFVIFISITHVYLRFIRSLLTTPSLWNSI